MPERTGARRRASQRAGSLRRRPSHAGAAIEVHLALLQNILRSSNSRSPKERRTAFMASFAVPRRALCPWNGQTTVRTSQRGPGAHLALRLDFIVPGPPVDRPVDRRPHVPSPQGSRRGSPLYWRGPTAYRANLSDGRPAFSPDPRRPPGQIPSNRSVVGYRLRFIMPNGGYR